MPLVTIQGQDRKYLFSAIPAESQQDLPSWGGVFMVVRARGIALQLEDVMLLGSTDNFAHYGDKIFDYLQRTEATHVYLLPEYKNIERYFTLDDLAATAAFQHIPIATLGDAKHDLPVVNKNELKTG